ncbi:PAS domain S-box protein [Marinobacter halodurans]|nr:PAS domain S-box protein [Marinobacter halodurans]
MPDPIPHIRLRTCLSLAVAFLLMSLGLIALGDQVFNADPRQPVWALLPSTMLLVFAAALLFTVYLIGSRILVAIAALTTLGLSLLILFWPATDSPETAPYLPLDDVHHGSGITALTLAALGVRFLSALSRTNMRPIVAITSAVLVVSGALSLASVWLPALAPYSYSIRPETNLLLGPILILAGWALTEPKPLVGPGPDIPPRLWISGALCALVATVCWYGVRTYQINDMIQRNEQLTQHLRKSISDKYRADLSLVDRIASRWQASNELPELALWYTEALTHLRGFPEIHVMAVLDGMNVRDQVMDRRPESARVIEQAIGSESGRDWLEHIDRHAQATMGPTLISGSQKPYAVIAAPLRLPGHSEYKIAALINLRTMIGEVLDARDKGFALSVTRNGQVVFDSQEGGSGNSSTISRETLSFHHDDPWTIASHTASSGFPVAEFYLPASIFFTGSLMTTLFLVSLAGGHQSRQQNRAYSRLNERLSELLAREREVRHTNERIMHFSPDILCSISANGRFVQVNPASQHLFGYTPDALKGQHISMVVDPADLGATMEKVKETIEDSPTVEFRNHCLHRDGHTVSMVWSAEWSEEDNALFCVGRDISANITAELLAKERQQFFSLTPEMFCIVDLNGLFFETNPAFSSVLGYSQTELIGASYMRLVVEEDRNRLAAAVNRLIGGKSIHDLEIRVLDRHHGEHWLQLNAVLSDDELIYCAARDITPIKRTQEALKQSQDLLRISETAARIGGWELDRVTLRARWTDMVYELHGLEPDSCTPSLQEIIDAFAPEDRPRLKALVDACFEQGTPFDEELRLHPANGTRKWVRTIGHAVVGDDGQVIRLQGALQDITQIKQSQDEIRRLDQRLTTVFESITDAFFTLDHSWRFTRVNSRSEELLRRSADDLLGRSLWDLFPEARGTIFESEYGRALETGESVFFETYYEPLDIWVEVSAYPSEEGLAVYFRSIGERKRAEADLKRTLEELERSNQELESFAFVASHDLQEPLRKIQTFADRLISRSEMLPDTEKDYLKRMQSAASRMQSLIRDLLSYSRITTRAKPFTQCDTSALIDAILGDMETTIQAEEAVIKVDDLPPVFGDDTQIRQVLQNLISNSVKFHKKDTPPYIAIRAEDVTVQEWTLCIQDNGVGFDMDYAERIFEPFQRLHSRDEFPGTGIGLAIVKKVLERHHARFAVESCPGEGSLFRMTFPRQAQGLRSPP